MISFLSICYILLLIFVVYYKIKNTKQKLRAQKIVLDSLLVALIFILCIPVYVIVAFIIFITEGRPIFYKSKRHVSLTKSVSIIKFRSMVVDASSLKYDLQNNYLKEGFLNIPLEHEVYTPIGRFLERFQIVELPQLYNVIKNGMSIVGNRPLPLENIQQFEDNGLDYKKRFFSPSGLTGISQIVNKHNLTSKQRLNLENLYSKVYLEGNVWLLDLKIITYTALYIIFKKELSYDDAVLMLHDHLK